MKDNELEMARKSKAVNNRLKEDVTVDGAESVELQSLIELNNGWKKCYEEPLKEKKLIEDENQKLRERVEELEQTLAADEEIPVGREGQENDENDVMINCLIFIPHINDVI